ncbi:DUF3466 family protein [Pseudoalteromonas luteoviolacea]|uniref:DUF3466 family protein n=1 Tax=Pseudoalteromonas luteoviolacea S4054 TaxID=1129367 RepID=A0A0F6AEV1_9GAMM|nr:DUF3466 family protein [Pseudoalteromonas luteoviolacea]AOT08448.1 hypothetical protein S4054249_11585 [Pseudoalteromonas luteoviolacea]AOT13364.1 hypothetical protein S40542_11560 [Pseudoalteromonas luteoviolacea]AOT18277.1 hypothetical protein S4054_11560 [Pseudoalteromonas luteoviolacea]KKE84735.1 hypothetical protein N479_00690 [Pseudoalteromonas luteoviolacea S4054]KZN75994.1 hypothetical protein N481_06505 [Pseudoalteromonas luteoviolacea S4047-1]
MRYTLLAASIGLCFSGQLFAATYQLTELPSFSASTDSTVVDANESGDVVGRATGLFNLKIDTTYIDFNDDNLKADYNNFKEAQEKIDDPIEFTLDDIENNNATATDVDAHDFMRAYLNQRSGNAEFQKLNSSAGLIYSTTTADEKVIFDVERAYTNNELSRSVVTYINGVASDGSMVGWGSAPYSKRTDFVKNDESEPTVFFERAFSSRGVFISPGGEVIELPPAFVGEYGGFSVANHVERLDDGTYLVVGQSSIDVAIDGQQRFDDLCKGENEPVNVCVWELQNGSIYYNRHAYQWKLDANFNIIEGESKLLGLGIEREENEERVHLGTALAVNQSGYAVGHSQTRKDGNFISRQRAGYYKDDKFTQIIEHNEGYEASRSLDINNNNIVIGYRFNELSTFQQVKGYYYNIDSKTVTEMESFSNGSGMYPRDINDAGYIVGQAEVEDIGDSPRREAFIYNTANAELLNLNDLIPCKRDDFTYRVGDAVKITEDNRIYAVATKTVKRRDSLGNVTKNSAGEDEFESVSVPVLLTPINGEPEQCPAEEAETYERSSASFGMLGFLALPLLMLRRRRK